MSYKWNRNDIEKEVNYVQHGMFYRCAPVPFTSTETASSRGTSGHRRGFTESTMRVVDRPRRIQYGPFVVLSQKKNYIGGHDSSCHATNWTIEHIQDKVFRPGRTPNQVDHGVRRKLEKNRKLFGKLESLVYNIVEWDSAQKDNKCKYTNAIWDNVGDLKTHLRNQTTELDVAKQESYDEFDDCAYWLREGYADVLEDHKKKFSLCVDRIFELLDAIDKTKKRIDQLEEDAQALNDYNAFLDKRIKHAQNEIETTRKRVNIYYAKHK